MIKYAGEASSLGVDNVVERARLTPKHGKLLFWEYSICCTNNGQLMDLGTNHLPPLMPTIIVDHHVHTPQLCILTVQAGIYSNPMACEEFHGPTW
jgi:hypothetical protein